MVIDELWYILAQDTQVGYHWGGIEKKRGMGGRENENNMGFYIGDML